MAARYPLSQRSAKFGNNIQGVKREKKGWNCPRQSNEQSKSKIIIIMKWFESWV